MEGSGAGFRSGSVQIIADLDPDPKPQGQNLRISRIRNTELLTRESLCAGLLPRGIPGRAEKDRDLDLWEVRALPLDRHPRPVR
jgi:hypothetical protein